MAAYHVWLPHGCAVARLEKTETSVYKENYQLTIGWRNDQITNTTATKRIKFEATFTILRALILFERQLDTLHSSLNKRAVLFNIYREPIGG